MMLTILLTGCISECVDGDKNDTLFEFRVLISISLKQRLISLPLLTHADLSSFSIQYSVLKITIAVLFYFASKSEELKMSRCPFLVMIILFNAVLLTSGRREMTTIIQNLSHECFENQHGVNPEIVNLDNVEIGPVIPNSDIFTILLKNVTINGIHNYKVNAKKEEDGKFAQNVYNFCLK